MKVRGCMDALRLSPSFRDKCSEDAFFIEEVCPARAESILQDCQILKRRGTGLP